MELTMPKTKEQKDYEMNMKYLIAVMSELSQAQQKQVIDYAVFLANE